MRTGATAEQAGGMSWWKLALVALGLPVVAFVVFLGWVFVSFSGGLDDVLDLDHPPEGDPDVVAAEERARHAIGAVTAAVRRTMVEAAGGTDAGGAGGVTPPTCEIGQHNFKIDD